MTRVSRLVTQAKSSKVCLSHFQSVIQHRFLWARKYHQWHSNSNLWYLKPVIRVSLIFCCLCDSESFLSVESIWWAVLWWAISGISLDCDGLSFVPHHFQAVSHIKIILSFSLHLCMFCLSFKSLLLPCLSIKSNMQAYLGQFTSKQKHNCCHVRITSLKVITETMEITIYAARHKRPYHHGFMTTLYLLVWWC